MTDVSKKGTDASKEMDENKDTQTEGQIEEGSQVLAELAAIKEELSQLNRHRLTRIYNSTTKMMIFHFLRGVAMGLGSIFGATVVLSFVVYLLSQVEFVPIIGDWVSEIIQQVRSATSN